MIQYLTDDEMDALLNVPDRDPVKEPSKVGVLRK